MKTYRDIWDQYCLLLRQHHREIEAANRTLREAPLELLEELQLLVESCTFSVRHYGGGQFYCWAQHDKYDLGDPWPAARWPKRVLAMTFVYLLMDRAKEVA